MSIKKIGMFFSLGLLSLSSVAYAGDYKTCSRSCSEAKCQADAQRALECAKWCEGIPSLNAVYKACKAARPVAESAAIKAEHQKEQFKQGRRVAPPPPPPPPHGGGAPVVHHPLPVAYDDASVKAFCEAYRAVGPRQLFADHPTVTHITATVEALPGPADIAFHHDGHSSDITVLRPAGGGLILDTSHLHSWRNNSVRVNIPHHAGFLQTNTVIIYGTAGVLKNKALCKARR
tara:strand:+ start:623 stop:1318 length:696 start_codon:yes stop_codon:yes gene_type:complete